MDEAYMYVHCKSNLFEATYKAKTNVLMVVMQLMECNYVCLVYICCERGRRGREREREREREQDRTEQDRTEQNRKQKESERESNSTSYYKPTSSVQDKDKRQEKNKKWGGTY